jgi:pimeloyl-ACP methyl ester carboxylesterase
MASDARASKTLLFRGLPVALGLLLGACATQPPRPLTFDDPSLAEHVVDVPSGKAAYIDTGGPGVPVVFLHSDNMRGWIYQVGPFTKAGYRFIAIDYRDRRKVTSMRVEDYVARVDEVVTKLGLSKFHLVGNAVGSLVGMQYGLAHRDKLRTLVLSNTLGGLKNNELNALEQSLRPEPFNKMPRYFLELSPTYRAGDPEGMKRYLAMITEGDAIAPYGGIPFTQDHPLTLADLDAWKVPTLMMTGDADLWTPPSIMRIFVSHLQHGKGVVIPESGHDGYWENPEFFNREVLNFIRQR